MIVTVIDLPAYSLGMLARFTEAAREVVVKAADEARFFAHHEIGTEHVLLGLLDAEDGLGWMLAPLGITHERVRAEVARSIGLGDAALGSSQQFGEQAKGAFECACAEADHDEAEEVSPQHLLLGLLRVGDGLGARLLRDLGAEPDALRDRLRADIEGAHGSPPRHEPEPPQASLKRFTFRATRVLALAPIEARLVEHSYVGSEHLLLALLWEGENLASRVLGSLSITRERVRERVGRTAGAARELPAAPTPFNDETNAVLERAGHEATPLGHSYIGPEHLLLALTTDGRQAGARILIELGVELGTIRKDVARTFDPPATASRGVARAKRHPAFELRFEHSGGARCSFCGEQGRMVGSCIASARDIWICEGCIDLLPRVVSMHSELDQLRELDELRRRRESGA